MEEITRKNTRSSQLELSTCHHQLRPPYRHSQVAKMYGDSLRCTAWRTGQGRNGLHVEVRPYFLQAKKGAWDEAMLQAGLDVAARNFRLKLNDKPLM